MSSFVLSLALAAAAGSIAPAGPPEGIFDPPPVVRHQLEEGATKRAAFQALKESRGAAVKSWASELPPPTIDVRHYELDLDVDPERQILSGSVTADIVAVEDGLATVVLDADLNLRVLSVLQLGDARFPYDSPVELAFEQADDLLTVDLPRPLAAGDAIRLQVTYNGHAWRVGLIGGTGVNWYSTGGTPVIHTFAQPFGARVWWPCNDRPDDKATVSLRVTVPEGLDVAANGLERSYTDNGDGTSTAVWSSVYDVPTYLVVMHISDFVYSESTYTGLDGTTMPVGLWAMPQVAAQAEADLAVTVPQIEVMAGKWGEYPFLDEKYGNATVFFGGGMEHQTMTTLAVGSVGDPWMEWLNVHELGHQWWGDWITMDDWRHIWLNEGFATHTEWLWAEHLGPGVFAQYLEDEDYLGQFRGAVYDNPEPFSWTIYAKGSWVAWMLRHVIGDDAFFDAMAAYRTAHGGATATTDNLREAMEAVSGMQLDWFFDQWVYGLYRPRYVYDWRNTGDFVLDLEVRQVQTNTGLFRMPVDVSVTTAAGVENHRVWFEAEAEQSIEIQLQAPATAVAVDPDTKLLAEIAHVSQPDLELGPDFPDGYDFGVVAGADRAIRTLPLTNTGGVDLVVEGIWPQSGGSFRLNEPPEFPLTIAPGDTRSVEILYDPTGFGRQTDRFYIGSNDPDRQGAAYLRVAGTGSLYEEAFLAVPSAASAGRVPLGGTGQAAFDALNLGGEPLAIQVTIEGDGFFPANIVPPVLAPGSSNVVRVRFQPTTVGAASGSVIFHTGDPADPLKTVSLSAIVDGAPHLELSPAALSLGVGDGSATASLVAVNSGTEDLIISTVAVEPPFVLSDPPVGSVIVPPGASSVITVALDDSPTGTLDGRLTLHSNDPAIPVARVPLRAHVTDGPVDEASFAAAASGPGLGDSRWTTRAFLLNPTDRALQTDLVFRPAGQRAAGVPDVGFEVPARSQRVIPDLVAAAGAAGTGGVNLRSSGAGLVAVSRTFAAGSGGSYGQFIGAESHIDALDGGRRYLLAGLAGNGGFHSNVGVLNLGGDSLTIDLSVFGPGGDLIGTRRLTAQPGAFKQLVAVISKLTDEVVRGGYATFTAVETDARYLAYGSVVDDASNDPTLVLPQDIDNNGSATDLVVPAVASLPGAAGTMWRSQLDLVNTTSEPSSVTLEYVRAEGSSVTSMAIELAPGAALHLDDVVGDLFGEHGKGWLRISAPGGGIRATSRTFNDDANGTYGQLISAAPAMSAVGPSVTVLLPGLSSRDGLRTNLGLTSLAPDTTGCTIRVFDNDGAAVGELPVELPPSGFVQIERALAGELGFLGDAWAEVSCSHPSAAFFAHASVIDEITGDPTTIPAIVVNE